MIVFWVMSLGLLAWTLGCYACCALVVTSPVGALIIRGRASARGIDGGARTGAWYWAAGFVPWVCYLYLVNGRPLPARLLNLSFRLMIGVWLVGPVISGGIASGSAPGPNNQWMLLVPAVNLGMIALAVGWRSVAGRTGPQDVRLRGGDTMPFLFGAIGMLSLLPQAFLMPLILSLTTSFG